MKGFFIGNHNLVLSSGLGSRGFCVNFGGFIPQLVVRWWRNHNILIKSECKKAVAFLPQLRLDWGFSRRVLCGF